MCILLWMKWNLAKTSHTNIDINDFIKQRRHWWRPWTRNSPPLSFGPILLMDIGIEIYCVESFCFIIYSWIFDISYSVARIYKSCLYEIIFLTLKKKLKLSKIKNKRSKKIRNFDVRRGRHLLLPLWCQQKRRKGGRQVWKF